MPNSNTGTPILSNEQLANLAESAFRKAEAAEIALVNTIAILSLNLPHLRDDVVKALEMNAEDNKNNPKANLAFQHVISLLQNVKVSARS